MGSFAKDLWDKTELIIKSSQERRKETEDLISAISKRIDVEETYAKGVEEAAKIIERAKQGDDNVSSLAFTSFKFDCMNRSSQSRTFAKSLREEILTTLKDLVSSQGTEGKEHEKEYKKLDKELTELHYGIVKSKNRFEEQLHQREEVLMLNQISLQSSRTARDKRLKIMTKTNEIMKELTQLEKNYQRAVTDYNCFLDQYYTKLQRILDVFQKQEQARLARQEETIIKMLIFETSMMKNFEYDIASVSKQVEKAKLTDELQEFIDKNRTGKKRDEHYSKILYKNMLGETVFRMVARVAEKRITLFNNKELKAYVEKKFKGDPVEEAFTMFDQQKLQEIDELYVILSHLRNGQAFTPEAIERSKVLLNDETNRLAVLLYFQEFQLTFNVSISPQAYDQILIFLQQLLGSCILNQDVLVARKITNLTFNIFTIKDNDKKYLFSSISSNRLFRMDDYWQASVFESVQEEMYLHFGDNAVEEIQLRETTLILGQLAMYCHQMIMLGFPSREVRQSIGWFCRLYNIPDDLNRDLARTVSASLKKYKEMMAPKEGQMQVARKELVGLMEEKFTEPDSKQSQVMVQAKVEEEKEEVKQEVKQEKKQVTSVEKTELYTSQEKKAEVEAIQQQASQPDRQLIDKLENPKPEVFQPQTFPTPSINPPESP